MKRLIVAILTICISHGVLIVAVRAAGAARPLAPTSFTAIFIDSARRINGVWCWQRVCPGTTRQRGTNVAQLAVRDYTVDFHMRGFSTLIIEVVLTDMNLTLGDVLVTYGSPDIMLNYPPQPTITDLCYDDTLCFRLESASSAKQINAGRSTIRLTPTSLISGIFFIRKERGRPFDRANANADLGAQYWQGFRTWAVQGSSR